MNKGCRDAQMAVFFFFHEAGEGVGMERMLCWWLAELLLVVGGASVCDSVELLLEKKQSLRLGGFEGLVCSEKTVIFAERFVERFFLSVNSCMIGSYLRFEKK
ncbi:hypothetical protein NXW75_27475 [Bacteroides xylanisolvens]|nr:hypothetical protein [Bacteroides xylanisolvens]